jgi:hypothetical protein
MGPIARAVTHGVYTLDFQSRYCALLENFTWDAMLYVGSYNPSRGGFAKSAKSRIETFLEYDTEEDRDFTWPENPWGEQDFTIAY